MQPVLVSDGGLDSQDRSLPDRIGVLSGDAIRASAPTRLEVSMTDPMDALRVGSIAGIAAGEHVWIAEGSRCALLQVSAPDAWTRTLQRDPGSAWPTNPTAAEARALGWPAFGVQATVQALGRLHFEQWQVRGTDLVTVDAQGNVDIVVGDVVNFQVQYGLSQDATTRPVSAWRDAPLADPADVARIRVIRVALLVRAADVALQASAAASCPQPPAVSPWPGAPAMAVGQDVARGCQRYRLVQTEIPLRNALLALG